METATVNCTPMLCREQADRLQTLDEGLHYADEVAEAWQTYLENIDASQMEPSRQIRRRGVPIDTGNCSDRSYIDR